MGKREIMKEHEVVSEVGRRFANSPGFENVLNIDIRQIKNELDQIDEILENPNQKK